MASIAVSSIPPQKSSQGTNIMVAGIVFQMASIFIFTFFLGEFLRRASKDHGILAKKVKILTGATLISCLLIVVRSIYRTVELLQRWNGYLITHEGYFIGLDGVLMFLAVAVFNLAHPGWFMPERKEEELKSMEPLAEKKEEHFQSMEHPAEK